MAEERPSASSEIVLARMKRQARENTRPELLVRRALHSAGFRYRVHYPVPGKPRRKIDIAFTRAKVAVFIDGCFWHGCPIHSTLPNANAEWWRDKISANRRRDLNTNGLLREAGWLALRFWEHENAMDAASAVRRAVDGRLRSSCGNRLPTRDRDCHHHRFD